MKDSVINLINNIANLIDLKSIVTLAMTALLGVLLSGYWTPPQGITELFCTAYGSILTYYFTHKGGGSDEH